MSESTGNTARNAATSLVASKYARQASKNHSDASAVLYSARSPAPGNTLGSIPWLTKLANVSRMRRAVSDRPVASVRPGRLIIVSRPPIPKPRIARYDRLTVRYAGERPSKYKSTGSKRKSGDPVGRLPHCRAAGRRSGYRCAVMVETAGQRGREVDRWHRFEACNDPTPLSRDQRHRYLADAEMIINRVQAALRLDRKSEIPVPITLGDDIATGRANGQPKELGIRDDETLAIDLNPGLKATD